MKIDLRWTCPGIFLALMVVSPQARGGLVYSTGFEAPTYSAGIGLGGQDRWVEEFSSAGFVTTARPYSGSQSLQVNGADLIDDPAFGIFVADYRQDLSYDAITNGTPLEIVQMALRLDGPGTDMGNGPGDDLMSANLVMVSNTGHFLGSMILSSNGHVYVFAEGLDDYSFGTVATLGEYHTLAGRFDFRTGEIAYYVDGLLIGQNVVPAGGGTGIGYIRLDIAALDDGSIDPSRFTAYYDDLRVTASAVPEPPTFALAGLAGLGGLVLAARRRTALVTPGTPGRTDIIRRDRGPSPSGLPRLDRRQGRGRDASQI